MQYTLATLGLAALAAAIPAPQGVTSAISPSTTAPAGCSANYNGEFQIEIVNVTSSSSKAKRQQSMSGELKITLQNGVLTDQDGRTGYIAANNQFQFDKPAQTGAIYTAGWSVCSNGSLAIGNDAVFQGCLSGTFYNLYDENSAPQCTPVYIVAVGAGGSSASGGQQSDGQPTASSVATQLTDGQPNGTPASSYPTTSAAATQITDGQPQAPTIAPHPVTQISDGQIQGSTAPASTPVHPITQISDGQPQAPTQVVSQISDGQIQAPTNGTNPTPTMSVIAYTGAAAMPTAGLLGLGAALLAAAAL